MCAEVTPHGTQYCAVTGVTMPVRARWMLAAPAGGEYTPGTLRHVVRDPSSYCCRGHTNTKVSSACTPAAELLSRLWLCWGHTHLQIVINMSLQVEENQSSLSTTGIRDTAVGIRVGCLKAEGTHCWNT